MSTLLLDILNWKLGQGPPLSRTHFWRAYAVCEAMVRISSCAIWFVMSLPRRYGGTLPAVYIPIALLAGLRSLRSYGAYRTLVPSGL
jgi:hypothetical protein